MTDKEKEIEELKSALSDAIHSFTRMETLYKVKCNELKIANDKIAGLTGKVEALQQDNENLMRTLEDGTEVVEEAKKETAQRIYQKLYDLCTRDDNPFRDYDLCAEDSRVGKRGRSRGGIMTDKEFAIELIRHLQDVDDTCLYCIHNPKNAICDNSVGGYTDICYNGIKAFMEKERTNGKTPKNRNSFEEKSIFDDEDGEDNGKE